MRDKQKFIGMNLLTGRKIYLSKKEELVMKKQWNEFYWIAGIILLLGLIYIIFLMI